MNLQIKFKQIKVKQKNLSSLKVKYKINVPFSHDKASQSKIDTRLTLVIQNSKGGALLVSKIKFNRLQWEDRYKFLTSIDQNVEFVLVKGDQKEAQLKENILGRGKLYTKKFFKIFGQKILSQQKQGHPFQYEVTLYKEGKNEEIVAGVVKIDVQLDSHKHFAGQIISNADLDLRGQVHSNPKFVKFYLGKSSKINFFSLFDDKINDQKFRFIQSIYKDLE